MYEKLRIIFDFNNSALFICRCFWSKLSYWLTYALCSKKKIVLGHFSDSNTSWIFSLKVKFPKIW